jgi:hypothetical protein
VRPSSKTGFCVGIAACADHCQPLVQSTLEKSLVVETSKSYSTGSPSSFGELDAARTGAAVVSVVPLAGDRVATFGVSCTLNVPPTDPTLLALLPSMSTTPHQ